MPAVPPEVGNVRAALKRVEVSGWSGGGGGGAGAVEGTAAAGEAGNAANARESDRVVKLLAKSRSVRAKPVAAGGRREAL